MLRRNCIDDTSSTSSNEDVEVEDFVLVRTEAADEAEAAAGFLEEGGTGLSSSCVTSLSRL